MNKRSETQSLEKPRPGKPRTLCSIACLSWLCLVLLTSSGKASGLGGTPPEHLPSPNNAKQTLTDHNFNLSSRDYFPPPDDGEQHRILVIDQKLWGFITAESQTPRKILDQTAYALDPHDWTIWGRPLQTEFGNFYVLLIIRNNAATQPNDPANQAPQPTPGSTNRYGREIALNRLIYRRLIRGGYAKPYNWNVRAPHKHSLQNVIVVDPTPVVHQPATELSNGQTVIEDPGQARLVREFRVLTEIDGIAVDKQAVASQVISQGWPKIVAIGVKYDSGHTVPDWQRPLLIEMAGIEPGDWEYVDYIIHHESRWKPRIKNQSSGAYGLCQSLPARKMSSAGEDYQDNAITQLKWCHDYAQSRYGGWEQAHRFWTKNRWW